MNIKTATVGEIITELVLEEIKATKEINSVRGLTKKTEGELDKMYKELLNRGILTAEQVEKLNQ